MFYDCENRWNAVRRKAGVVATGACAVALSAVMVMAMSGCSTTSSATASASPAAAASTPSAQVVSTGSVKYDPVIDESVYKLDYSNRDKDASYDASSAVQVTLNGSSAAASNSNVTVDGPTVTISAEGVYVLSGSLQNGQVVVNAPENAKVQLVLDGASITNANGPAVLVKQADKCFVTLKDGTENALADGAKYADDAEENAALYSYCDLTLQGAGTLAVTGNGNDAVKTKDDLVITGGAYTVKATGDGLVGHDSVKIAAGSVTVDAGNDGIKSTKDDNDSKGFVSFDGGTVNINATDKGVNAYNFIRVADSADVRIVSGDDAIHSDHYARIAGGTLSIKAGDDAVHAEYVLAVDDGTVNVESCVEGYEAQVITINGATTSIVSSDDGINASVGGTSSSTNNNGFVQGGNPGQMGDMQGRLSGEGQGGGAQGGAVGGMGQGGAMGERPGAEGQANGDAGQGGRLQGDAAAGGQGGDAANGAQQGAMGGRMGVGMMDDADENCILTFNGGTVIVQAEGDGVDSNGYIYMNGGTVYVSGPTTSGNGSLDYGLGAEAKGGTFIAAGSVGMAESFTGGTQGSALVNASGSAGSAVSVLDSNGAVIAEFTPSKSFQCVIVSAPGMTDGGSYTLSVNGTETAFTASTSGSSNGVGGMGGMGGMGGGRPDGGQMGPQGGMGGQVPDGAQGGGMGGYGNRSWQGAPTGSTTNA